MSSRAVRALYRLFLRQARALERNGVPQLDVRAPISKGEDRAVGWCICRAGALKIRGGVLQAASPPRLLAEAWLMQQGGHGWAPPRDEFHLRSLQQLFPWAAEVGSPALASVASGPAIAVCSCLPAWACCALPGHPWHEAACTPGCMQQTSVLPARLPSLTGRHQRQLYPVAATCAHNALLPATSGGQQRGAA